MRPWFLIAALALVSCAHTPTVYLPKTAEAQACNRQCMMIYNACYGNGCGQQSYSCLMSCPGAMTKDQLNERLAPK